MRGSGRTIAGPVFGMTILSPPSGRAPRRAVLRPIAALALGASIVACNDQSQASTRTPTVGSTASSPAPVAGRVGRIRADLKQGLRFTVASDGRSVSLRAPDGGEETMAWADVVRIVVVTTDEGPTLSDVFIFLESPKGALVIPQDAQGNESFVDVLLKVDGFNYGPFMAAMSSGENAEFECWSGGRLQFRRERPE